jgi:hypothetical protein
MVSSSAPNDNTRATVVDDDESEPKCSLRGVQTFDLARLWTPLVPLHIGLQAQHKILPISSPWPPTLTSSANPLLS